MFKLWLSTDIILWFKIFIVNFNLNLSFYIRKIITSHSLNEPAIPALYGLITPFSLTDPNSIVYQYNAPIFSIYSSEAPKVNNPISWLN
jgi:hypothetical protein